MRFRTYKGSERWDQRNKQLIVSHAIISWAIALLEYIFQVPANRLGSQMFTVTQLKVMQECITLVVFTGIAYLMFGGTLRWNNFVSYGLIVGAVYFSFGFSPS